MLGKQPRRTTGFRLQPYSTTWYEPSLWKTTDCHQRDSGALWNNEQTDRQTDGHCVTVVLVSSPVWCTAACHWSAVCAYPSKESSSSWLLPLSLYLEAIKVLLSEKWTDKRGVCQAERKTGQHFSANLWSPHTLNKALKDTERSDDISVVGEEEPSHPSFMLMKSLLCNYDMPLSFLQVQLWSSQNASKINCTTQ